MFPPALAIQQANDAVPGTVPKIAGPNLYLQSDSAGKGAIWTSTVAGGTAPTLFYADQAARRAVTLTVGMLYSVARQASDGSLWIVIPPLSGTTPVWGPLCAGPEASATPLTLITSTTPKLWLDSQLGAGANTWSDQTANHFDMTEATHPPTLTTLGTVPCYTGNGTNQLFTASGLTLTIGSWYWMIVRQISWTANASICGGSAATPPHTMLQDGGGSDPAVAIYNTGVVDRNPTAMTTGSWFRVMFKFSNNVNDYLQVGASGNKITGNPGALTGTGWQLFARAGANFGNVAIANVVVCSAEPTTGEKNALDAWYAAKSFGGVVGF